jgi:hypothetical protein
MSNLRFCHSCGKQQILGAKFCSYCGTNLLSLSSPTPIESNSKAEASFVPFASEKDDDDSDYLDKMTHFIPKINSFEIESITNLPLQKKESLANVVQQGIISGPTNEVPRIISNKPFDQKEFLAEFQRIAGTKRLTDASTEIS